LETAASPILSPFARRALLDFGEAAKQELAKAKLAKLAEIADKILTSFSSRPASSSIRLLALLLIRFRSTAIPSYIPEEFSCRGIVQLNGRRGFGRTFD
jgi:hypothetical protein